MDKYYLDDKTSIFLIIDIQERLAPVIYNKDQVIKNTNILIEGLKELNLPMLITEQYPKGLGKTVDELKVDGIEIFEKISFSAYTEEIKKKLEEYNRKKIIVVGMESHICVYQTVRDLIKNGYDVHLVEDAVGSRTKDNCINGINLMKDMGAVITNTETVLFDLLKKARTQSFKKISNLIK